MTDFYSALEALNQPGAESNTMTPEEMEAWQAKYWMPGIPTGGYIPQKFDNAEYMASIGQSDAYAQRQQYLDQLGRQRVANLAREQARDRRGGPAALGALAIGTLGGMAGALGGAGAAAGAKSGALGVKGGVGAKAGTAAGVKGGSLGVKGALNSILPGEVAGVPAVIGGGGGALGGLLPTSLSGWIDLGVKGAGVLGSIMGGGPGGGQPGSGEVGTPTSLPAATFSRSRNPVQPDYYTYGKKGGEHRFFIDGGASPATGATGAPPSPEVGYAPRGPRRGQFFLAEGGMAQGAGSGRADTIEALLSDGEYVIDAESVALLGDGSVDEGAARLDQLRENLRKHKGAALAQGKFSPSALPPEQYMPGMAKGGRMRVVGGQATPPARQERLNRMRTLESEVRTESQDRDLQGALERLKNLKALREKHPIKKAEGGPVAEMSQLADKLEAALQLGTLPEIDSAMTPVLEMAKGGNIKDAIAKLRARINQSMNVAPSPLEYLKLKHPQGSPVIDMLEGRRAPPVDTRRARTPEEIAAEQRVLEGVELLRLLSERKTP